MIHSTEKGYGSSSSNASGMLDYARQLPANIDSVVKKMWKNSVKAIEEHAKKDPGNAFTRAYVHPGELLLPTEATGRQGASKPLVFSHSAFEAQGPRPAMEDAHFFRRIEQGVIAGVLDGHGGAQVSRFASGIFQREFSKILKEAKGNVRQAFETLFDRIHQKVAVHKEWNGVGSTAVICFIDKNTNLIYTATLGDSEANIYRAAGPGLLRGRLKSVPLSCVRDWSSIKDAARAALALDNKEIAEAWPKAANPKRLRYPHLSHGLNVSRAIGDVAFAGSCKKPGVIHKPKITVHQMHPEDILVLGCDGLKDYVPENEIIDVIMRARSKENIAQLLVTYALNKKRARDNVTVLVISAVIAVLQAGHRLPVP
jgi:serine/threonine protein phosphatase PrpC